VGLPACHVHFVVHLVGIIFKERFRRPRITGKHGQIRNDFGEREIKSTQQNDGDSYCRAGSDQQNYAAKQSQEPGHPREMDNERRFQLAISWGKHAPAAIARLVPVCRLPYFILLISSLRQRPGYDALVEIPIAGNFLSRF
jgi:hypothetical protein